MKILFDGQIFVAQRAGGISRYFTALAGGLNEEPGVTAKIVAPFHRNEILASSRATRVVGLRLNDRRGAARLRRVALNVGSPIVGRLINADIVHETYFSPRPYMSARKRRVTTMYDMIHELYYPGDRTTEHKKAALARCDHVICISHNTKKDLCELFDFPSERATVTHLAYEDFSCFSDAPAPVALSGAPYFLYVGSRAVYKNFGTLLRAFAEAAQVRENFRVVCYGGGPFTESEFSMAGSLGLRPESLVHLTGSDDVLGAAYTHATAFVYPSLYEGFGIPPLEAMSAGCPVLCSNTSSLPEVVGDAALQFDPLDAEALRDSLIRVAFSEDLRRQLILRGHARRKLFSWQRCVEETLDVYRRVLQ